MRRLVGLRVRLDEPLDELRPELRPWTRAVREPFRLVHDALRRAAEDPRIGGVLLTLSRPGLGWSRATSLARGVAAVRRAGKPTIAYLEGGDNVDYLLASACETIVLQPGSILQLGTLRADVLFFKDLLETVGVDAELESVGEYKSVGEMFLRRAMSPPYREEVEAILADVTAHLVDAVAAGRGLAPEQVRERLAAGPALPDEALERGLADRIGHEDEAEALAEERLGGKAVWIEPERLARREGLVRRLLTWRQPRIAVLYAVGTIGAIDPRPSGTARGRLAARPFIELLRRVREARRVRAVVIRVESPGGSASASERIWREIALTRREKPVVVSMGDVAASGGYYIATAADAVVAEPTTITGSIGIAGGKFVVRRLLDRLGVARETVRGGDGLDLATPFRSYTAEERAALRRELESFYERLFLPRVAEGRRLPIERVRELARGRVWTGRQAHERGLVDVLGDLGAAIDLARERAGLPERKKVRVVAYARRPRLRDLLRVGPAWSGAHLRLGRPYDELTALGELLAGGEPLYAMTRLVRIR